MAVYHPAPTARAVRYVLQPAGYESSFIRYFYNPKPMRSLEEIRADILALASKKNGRVVGRDH